MALRYDHHVAPFGWSVAAIDARSGAVRDELRALSRWVSDTCEAHFPGREGYRVTRRGSETLEGDLRLDITRGDFRAKIAIEHRPADSGLVSIHVFGDAEADRLATAERNGQASIRRWRTMGVTSSIVVFTVICWLVIGVYDPMYVLGGMLMVVALVALLLAGSAGGTWVGEQLAERGMLRAHRAVWRDDTLQLDLRRWRSVARLIHGQRDAFARSFRGQPFRSLALDAGMATGTKQIEHGNAERLSAIC